MTWSHHLFLASQHTRPRTQSHPSIGYHHPVPILQKRQPRLSRIKKYAKSCPWKIIMPGFEHLPSDKGSLQIFRLTHTRDTRLKGTSYSEAWHDISCNSHTHTHTRSHARARTHTPQPGQSQRLMSLQCKGQGCYLQPERAKKHSNSGGLQITAPVVASPATNG